jgi:hypothetical protein
MPNRLMMSAALAGGALVLTACGSDAEPEPQTVTETTAAPAATAPAVEPVAPAQDAPQMPGRPALNQCVAVDPAPDGRYQVFDAGSAVVTFADGRLTLESVTPAEGWTHRVDDQEPDEVEIEFQRAAEELDLELEVDDGRLEVTICNDDD